MQDKPPAGYSNYFENVSRVRADFKSEIDVRGLRGDEALSRLIAFIDDAVMLNETNLRVLHGTGTGALKQIIRDYLRTCPFVSRFEDEHVQLGGAGITKITLDA
jgi:DNA mismatch repair protein MutS2